VGIAADRSGRNSSRALCDGNRPKGRCSPSIRQEGAENAARRNRTGTEASEGGHMTVPFDKLKARLLANPKVKAEYDALA
jgi:hypothetical protein